MAEGYCVKCKAKKEVVDAVETVMKNGRKAIKGKCPDCATTMFKILGGTSNPNGSDPKLVDETSANPRPSPAVSVAPTLPPITGSGGSKSD